MPRDMDYHLSVVAQTSAGYRAMCDCGWVGPTRDRRYDAGDDCLAHDETENPIEKEAQ